MIRFHRPARVAGSIVAAVAITALAYACSEGPTSTKGPTPAGGRASTASTATVTILPSSGRIAVGSTLQLGALLRDTEGYTLTGKTVAWSSSNSAVATVTSGGRVAGKAGGTATITATSDGKSGKATITVTSGTVEAVAVASVTVSPSSASITAGKTVQLTATTKDASGHVLTGRTVTWSSANTAIATVSSSGLVTGKAAGGPVRT
jgi:trimeric autotransporter adhesin